MFSTKRERVVKWGAYFKKEGASCPYFHTNSLQSDLSLKEWWCVFCLFTTYQSVFCVAPCMGKLSLIKSNQHICGFYSSVIFEKQRHCETL